MNNDIQFIIPEYDYDIDFDVDKKKTFFKELELDINLITNNVKIEEEDIGQGANMPVILLTLLNILILGKEINEYIDGWLGLATKVKDVFNKLKGKHKNILLSENAAKLMAIEFVSSENNIQSLYLTTNSKIILYGREGSRQTDIASCPACIYVFNITVNDLKSYCIAIRSNGKIEFAIKYEHPLDLMSD